jgi:hypothetical protein
MRLTRIAMLLVFVCAARAGAQSPAGTAAATITPDDVKQRIAFLASDQLKGRDTPSPGLELAAEYIAKEFASYGLKAGGDAGSFIQRWPFQSSKLDVSKVAAELRGPTPRKLVYGDEFFVVPAPNIDSLAGDLVFGGVAAAGVSAKPGFANHVVAFYLPGSEMNQEWLQGLQNGFISALTGGARGVLLILDPAFGKDAVANVISNIEGAQVPLPVLAVRYDVARDWLKQHNVDVETIKQSTDAAVLGKASFHLRTAMSGNTANPPNVVGILEGSDPQLKNTYVVYSAHMDHVGVGRPDAQGDSIYNGADDDASGTTAVMEIAQAFASMQTKPKRSLIFVLVSGEEKGLFGSAHFVKNPPVPAKQMVANINVDMVGRNAPDTTVAIGQDYSSLGPTMQAVNKAHPELKLTVAPDLWPEENLFVRSDHFNFAKAEIPAIFFTSGLHEDYHKPSDEPETIDNDKLARTARLLFYLGYDVANASAAPTWTEAGLKVIRGN